MSIDKYGYYMGRPVGEMTREELLELWLYAANKLERHELWLQDTADARNEARIREVIGDPPGHRKSVTLFITAAMILLVGLAASAAISLIGLVLKLWR